MSSLDLVRQFHEKFDQPVADAPNIDDDGLNELRVKLLEEELTELSTALLNRDPIDVLDALTDLQYVLDGAYLSLGFWRWKYVALAEVHTSNLSKLGPDDKPVKRADGKILKGDRYVPPNLTRVLREKP